MCKLEIKVIRMQQILENAVLSADLPFVVAMTGNSAGVTWSGVAGEAASGQAASLNTAFRLFSMTKAIGSCAAMILVDRGELSIDAPVASILPEWDKLQVLVGWDGTNPVFRSPKTTATVKHLASHTAGVEYELFNRDVLEYFKITGHSSITSGHKRALLNYPLTSDPGTSWSYGIGIDWLGQIVEAIDGRSIDNFCVEEIFEPLEMYSTHFEPDTIRANIATVFQRDSDGGFEPIELCPPPQPEFYGMGHALYSTAPDYLNFLRMILNRGQLNGKQILSEATLNIMLQNHMGDNFFKTMKTSKPLVSADVEMPEDTTHSFIATRTETDQNNRRRAGTQSWGGVCNTHFWVDTQSDIAAVFMTQSLPFMEPRFREVYESFEASVYSNQ